MRDLIDEDAVEPPWRTSTRRLFFEDIELDPVCERGKGYLLR